MAYKYAYEVPHLAVGKLLPNGWKVMAYAVSDRHAIVQACNGVGDGTLSYATWTVSNNDLRSTSGGHYHCVTASESWADFKDRVEEMYAFS